ncbi:transcription antitermination factor NusB [Edaphobacter sp. 12200R-103]|uniref:transcription antitermination factor NusB n=1 Tax=Edaphobacter sp. 12200R-103 TaxID=2703788 RepID=UPI00138C075C|nr:transcription antitermination factor NusB [Edaphobacter sp. 12200R-103]QHS50471.1 methyltransferase domain-containing protein [Edaphobacter sp. 12200R-103]
MLVASGRGNSDDLLHSSHTAGLSAEDRNLATALVLGTLRWQIALDGRIQTMLQRPDQRLAEPVAIALRLGAFQLLHLDRIPPHAAINESVELVRASGNPHATGMANAILRKVMTQKPGRPIHESTSALATRLSHPGWMVERWASNYGRSVAIKICEAGQRELGAPELFADSAEQDLPRMDDGSRLVAELAAVAAPGAARVWDTCAAPGGKSLILAKRLPGAKVLATDVSPRRLTAMRSRIAEYSYAAAMEIEVVDATLPPASLGTFDLILADVPCSGTGTLARNPEIRLRLMPADLSRHASRQRKILSAALKALEPGGRLLYSTCSLEPEECERVVEAVLAEKEFAGVVRAVSVEPLLRKQELLNGKLEGAVRGEYLRTLPGVHPGDGFFAALMERVG